MVSLEFSIHVIFPAAVWWTQPATEMSTKDISLGGGGKGGRCVGLTTSPPSCANYLEIWESQPLGTQRSCPCLYMGCSLWIQFTYVAADGRVLENGGGSGVWKERSGENIISDVACRPTAARVSTPGGCVGWNMQSVGRR